MAAPITCDGFNHLVIKHTDCPSVAPADANYFLQGDTWRYGLNIPDGDTESALVKASQMGYCIDNAKKGRDYSKVYTSPSVLREVIVSGEDAADYIDLTPLMCNKFGEKRATHLEITNYRNAVLKAFSKIRKELLNQKRTSDFLIKDLDFNNLDNPTYLTFAEEKAKGFPLAPEEITDKKFMEISGMRPTDMSPKQRLIANTIFHLILNLHIDPFFKIYIDSFIKLNTWLYSITKDPAGKARFNAFLISGGLPATSIDDFINTLGNVLVCSDSVEDIMTSQIVDGCIDGLGDLGPSISKNPGTINPEWLLKALLPGNDVGGNLEWLYAGDYKTHSFYTGKLYRGVPEKKDFDWNRWSSEGMGSLNASIPAILPYKIVDSIVNRRQTDLISNLYGATFLYPTCHEAGHKWYESHIKGKPILSSFQKISSFTGPQGYTSDLKTEAYPDLMAFITIEYFLKTNVPVDRHSKILGTFFQFMCNSFYDGVHTEGRIRANFIKCNRYLYGALTGVGPRPLKKGEAPKRLGVSASPHNNNTFSVITTSTENSSNVPGNNISSANFINSTNNAPVKGNLYRTVNNVLKNGVISKKGTIKRRNQPIGSKNPIVNNVDRIATGKNKTWRRERTGEQQFRNILTENPNIWNQKTKGWWLKTGGSRTRKNRR